MLSRGLFFCLILSCFFTSCLPPSVKKIYKEKDYHLVVSRLHVKAVQGKLNEVETNMLQHSIERILFSKNFDLTRKLHSESFSTLSSAFVSLDDVEKLQNSVRKYRQLDEKYLMLIDVDKWDRKFSDKLFVYHSKRFEESKDEFITTKNIRVLNNAHDQLDKMAYFKPEEVNLDSFKTVLEKYSKSKIKIKFSDNTDHTDELNYFQSIVKPQNTRLKAYGDFSNPDYTINIVLDSVSHSCQAVKHDEGMLIKEYVDSDKASLNKSYEATVKNVTNKYKAAIKVKIEVIQNEKDELLDTKVIVRTKYNELDHQYFISGDSLAYYADPTTNKNSPEIDQENYDYSSLLIEALESADIFIEYYLNNYKRFK